MKNYNKQNLIISIESSMDTKKQFNKTDGVQFYYAIQSFEEETNIEPMHAHQIAMEWVEKCYPGYQALVCTHMDTDNIHSHIIINSVSSLDGHKIHQNKNDIERVRYVNDQLCITFICYYLFDNIFSYCLTRS